MAKKWIFARLSPDHRHSLPKVYPSVIWRMRQRHEHLAQAKAARADIVLDDRVTALEAVLLAQAIKDPLG